jgi:hypothetical protein
MEGPNIICAHSDDDEKPLPNFIKRKHPRRGEKKKQGARTKVQASKQPNKGGPQGGKGTTKSSCYCKSTKVSPASFLFLTLFLFLAGF